METGPGNHVLLRDYLTDEITRLREELDAAEAELVCLDSRVARLRTQRDQLLAALKFYADEENWREEGSFLHLGSQVRADEGEIARAALAAVEDTA
jgi:hypothetical protein